MQDVKQMILETFDKIANFFPGAEFFTILSGRQRTLVQVFMPTWRLMDGKITSHFNANQTFKSPSFLTHYN